MTDVDVAIIGGGAAGLTAGVFARRADLRTVLFERQGPGGQLVNVHEVGNYPGVASGTPGYELGEVMSRQATEAGVEVRYDEVALLGRRPDGRWSVESATGGVVAAAVIVATGSTLTPLGLPREEDLHGRGLSYCASCDAEFFRDQPVAVVGGGDSALDETLLLAGVARSVVMVDRGAEVVGAASTWERVRALPNVSRLGGHVVSALEGGEDLAGITVTEVATGESRRLDVQGVFVYVGLTPATSLLDGHARLDARGHAVADAGMAAGPPGLFVAGDIRQGSPRLLVSCAADGAIAALSAARYVRTGAPG